MMFNCLHVVFIRLNECELVVKSRALGTQVSLVFILTIVVLVSTATFIFE